MSGNPFRRSQPPPALHPAGPGGHDGSRDQKPPARTKKHVRVASPPPEPSSPEIDNHFAAHFAAVHDSASPPPPVDSAASPVPFAVPVARAPSDDSTVDQESQDEDAPLKPAASAHFPSDETPPRALGIPNPFERTLAHIEPSTYSNDAEPEKTGPRGEKAADHPLNHRPKASMDVDSFKQLLMTGSADVTPSDGPAAPEVQPRANIQTGGDTSSGTDASSASRNSMFDSVLQTREDSPRRSYDSTSFDGGNEDDRSTPVGAEQPRAKPKPPPPKHRHGKSITRAPQTVSFSDFSPSPASPSAKPDVPRRTSSNGQKPLPPRPRVPSGQKQKDLPTPQPQSPAETVPAKQDAESPASSDGDMENSPPVKTPELSAPQRRKPPTPPLARRHSQLKSSDSRSRSNSAATLTSPPETPLSPADQVPATSATSSTPLNKPPPPPPTRRSGATSSATADFNPNAMSRSSSRRSTASSMHNPALSIRANRLSGSALDMTSPTGGPPPPPPRRGSSKSSFEMQRPSASALAAATGEGRRTGGEFKSRSRTASGASERVFGQYAVRKEDPTNPNGAVGSKVAGGAGGTDLLSELDKLQQEVEALRQKSTTKA